MTNQGLLRLLQIADSAIPIGSLAHSFGLETLVADGDLTLESLPEFMQSHLDESLLLEVVFCRAGYCAAFDENRLPELNCLLSARKPAREARQASLALGRRFRELISALDGSAVAIPDSHYSIAFGAACCRLEIDQDSCILAYLEQSCASVLSGLVRLMPLGQVHASAILWDLKDSIAKTCDESRDLDPRRTFSFAPMLENASMRHPFLKTRLFLS